MSDEAIKKIVEVLMIDYPFIPDCGGNFDGESCYGCQHWVECEKGDRRTRLLAELEVMIPVLPVPQFRK